MVLDLIYFFFILLYADDGVLRTDYSVRSILFINMVLDGS